MEQLYLKRLMSIRKDKFGVICWRREGGVIKYKYTYFQNEMEIASVLLKEKRGD